MNLNSNLPIFFVTFFVILLALLAILWVLLGLLSFSESI